jgi:long-chain acyl-CoA synthetase
MLTHGNLCHMPDAVNLGTQPAPGEIVLTILPTWHAYERAVEYYVLKHGATLTYSDKRYLKKDLEERKPHLFPCVPRIWETVYDAIQDRVSKSKPAEQKLFAMFNRIGRAYVKARRIALSTDVRRTPATQAERAKALAALAALAPAYKLGDALVFSKLRAVAGGRLRAAVSGGGSLAAYLDDFFEMVGIPILNGYGLTETSPVLTNRRTTQNVRGSVGLPMAQTEIQVRDETGKLLPQGQAGLIFGRGPQVMSGYYNNPEATTNVLDEKGWFNTGDLGWITPTGDLVISGRAKDTIVLVGGENVEPEPIEDAARKSQLIQQIVCVGQDQKFVGALVVPNYPALAAALSLPETTPPAELAAKPEANKLVRDAIRTAMDAEGAFKPSDSVSKVALLTEPFSEENGMLTQTMKIKRNVVAKHYETIIKQLFS